MTAVDRNYMLQWDWNYTHPGNFVTFTAEFTFWNDQYNEISYSRACEGLRKRQCNFTSFNLPFSGSFLIRARAKTEQQQSNWTKIRFTPDEESKLSPPSRVDVKADVGVLTLTISESVMSSVMNLQYSVLYWESSTPTQKHEKVFESTYAPLTSLKHRTEYCVQVNIFSLEHRKNSSYTSPQCVRTTGRPLVWLGILGVLCGIPLLAVLIYMFSKLRRWFTSYTAPDSIQDFPIFVPLLLEAQDESCTVPLVITPKIESALTTLDQQEMELSAKLEDSESVCHWTNNSDQDSGISSLQEG
ncbi:interferon alpha/beta receptor 1a-like isoform X3 [Trichomycterus rosablanca]